MSAAVDQDGVLLRHRDGMLVVPAKPSEVPPDQLAALRANKAALQRLVEAFGEVRVLVRPPTPIPDEPRLGGWIWMGEPRRGWRSRR